MSFTASPRYLVCPSPIGDILIVTEDDALVTVHPFDGPLYAEVARVSLALRAGLEPVSPDEPAGLHARAAAQLDEYFEGERQTFDLPLNWRLVRGFTLDALQAVCDIPYGETAGYGEVAIAAGSPRAARAVGTACATTPFSIVVPVHRVVRSDGSLGEYGGHPEVKEFLLNLEQRNLTTA
jgi:methylated-DNA-[protein]-cysteine S-methyltransferase